MYYFIFAFALSVVLTYLVRRLALRFKVVDEPDGGRHRHARPVPLFGGLAIFLSFWAVLAIIFFWNPTHGVELLIPKLWGVFFGSLLILLFGLLDDIRDISPRLRLFLTIPAVIIAIVGGLSLEKITNPLDGGFIALGTLLGSVLVFIWLMGMTYTTKILDGLDGLSTGLCAIGGLLIFFLTNTARYYQPNVGLVALVFSGVCLGFLIFNFYPAKIFLGESGSMLVGFLLGMLSVISGGKLAIALLVMAVPILDLVRVIFARLLRKQSLSKGDREHLHFRLIDWGLSQRRAVILFYSIAMIFGASALFLQSRHKLIAFIVLALAMFAFSGTVNRKL